MRAGAQRRYRAGQQLIEQGDTSRFVVLILSGQVKVVATANSGGPLLLAFRGRGELVGELSFLDQEPRSASVIALREVKAVAVDHQRFSRLLVGDARMSFELARFVGERLREADRRRIEFGARGVTARVARVLCEVAQVFDEGRPGQPVEVLLTQKELAQWTGAAEVTVQKALRGLRQRGLITTGHGKIAIDHLDELRRAADRR